MLIPKHWIRNDAAVTCVRSSAMTPAWRRILKTGTNTTPPPVPDVLAIVAPSSPIPGRNHSTRSRCGSIVANTQIAA